MCPMSIYSISDLHTSWVSPREVDWIEANHLYFIFVKVSNADPEVNLFIHALTFNFNEIKFILEGALLTHSTS